MKSQYRGKKGRKSGDEIKGRKRCFRYEGEKGERKREERTKKRRKETRRRGEEEGKGEEEEKKRRSKW